MVRYAARIDANQTQIVRALEACGAIVKVIGLPVDLLIGYKGPHGPAFAFMECKDGSRVPSQRKKTKVQTEFFELYAGWPVYLVESPEDAVNVLKVLRT